MRREFISRAVLVRKGRLWQHGAVTSADGVAWNRATKAVAWVPYMQPRPSHRRDAFCTSAAAAAQGPHPYHE